MLVRSVIPMLLFAASSLVQQPVDAAAPTEALERRVVRHHAAWCHGVYAAVRARADALRDSVDQLVAQPNHEHLEAARTAWIDARRIYGRTEVLRFNDGPIEPLEPLINAWPIDEAYIDYVVGDPNSGIINDPLGFPSLDGHVLQIANERGGEANICVGWHAIEFLLWGQDLSDRGPGARPATDFMPGVGPHAARRCAILQTITALLVQHLAELEEAWAPNRDNYRRRFEAEPSKSLRRILTGATVLSAFELGGERLTVAYDTRDQEQEHSCFSDQTCLDLVANQAGLNQVILGSAVAGVDGPGLVELFASEPAVAGALRRALETTTARLAAIPHPFDRAVQGSDDAAGRRAIEAAIVALEAQTEVLLIAGSSLGYDLPLAPGG